MKHFQTAYLRPFPGLNVFAFSQGRIKAGADGAAAPGPQPKIGPPLF